MTTLAEAPNFLGQIRFASEVTKFRIFYMQGNFIFLREGRVDDLVPGGGVAGNLLQVAISSSVHAVAKNGPASTPVATAERPNDVEKLLSAHRRNFMAACDDISDVQLAFHGLPALGWTKPLSIIWAMNVATIGRVKVTLWKESMPVAVPLLLGIFGDIILTGKWQWDPQTSDFRKRA